MELKYSIGKLAALGVLLVVLGLTIFLILIATEDLSQIKYIGIVAILLGEAMAVLVMALIGFIVTFAGGRLVAMAFSGASAAKITHHGIEVRSIYFFGTLHWNDIAAIQLHPAPMSSNAFMLTFVPKTQFDPMIKWVSMSDNVTIGTQLLSQSRGEVEQWITAASKRDAVPSHKPAVQPAVRTNRSLEGVPGVPGRSRGFGRKSN